MLLKVLSTLYTTFTRLPPHLGQARGGWTQYEGLGRAGAAATSIVSLSKTVHKPVSKRCSSAYWVSGDTYIEAEVWCLPQNFQRCRDIEVLFLRFWAALQVQMRQHISPVSQILSLSHYMGCKWHRPVCLRFWGESSQWMANEDNAIFLRIKAMPKSSFSALEHERLYKRLRSSAKKCPSRLLSWHASGPAIWHATWLMVQQRPAHC